METRREGWGLKRGKRWRERYNRKKEECIYRLPSQQVPSSPPSLHLHFLPQLPENRTQAPRPPQRSGITSSASTLKPKAPTLALAAPCCVSGGLGGAGRGWRSEAGRAPHLPHAHINKLHVRMQEVVCAQTQSQFIWILQGKVDSSVTQLVLGLKAKENVEIASVSLALTGRKGQKQQPSDPQCTCFTRFSNEIVLGPVYVGPLRHTSSKLRSAASFFLLEIHLSRLFV